MLFGLVIPRSWCCCGLKYINEQIFVKCQGDAMMHSIVQYIKCYLALSRLRSGWSISITIWYLGEKWLTLVHKLLKCLIARQNDLPVIQWFYAFTPTVIRSWDIGNVHINSGCCLRVNPTSDTSYEVYHNLDFVSCDSNHELGIKGALIEGLSASLIIGSEGCDSFCDKLRFRIRIFHMSFVCLHEEQIFVFIDDAHVSFGMPMLATNDERCLSSSLKLCLS